MELQREIQLDKKQVSLIQTIFDRMRSRAITEGERFISLERVLDSEFADHTVTERTLSERVAEVEESRRRLRFIHLSTHLETVKLLKLDQIKRYNALRGYAAKILR